MVDENVLKDYCNLAVFLEECRLNIATCVNVDELSVYVTFLDKLIIQCEKDAKRYARKGK